MRRTLRLPAVPLVAVLALALAGAPNAEAKRGLVKGFADGIYGSSDEAQRDLAFDWTVQAGAGIVRFNVNWRATAGAASPANPRDPADPAYQFVALDRAVREAAERGLDVLLTVYSAPPWAEGPDRPDEQSAPPGTWKPDPAALGDFAHALATRYSGAFPDPSGLGALPRVRFYQAWNEPNLPDYLTPQWSGHKPESPAIYRSMLNGFYSAVKGVNPDDVVVSAGTAPYGDPPGGPRVRPLLFARELMCLHGRKKLQPGECPDPPHLDVLAHHPINTSGGPRRSAVNPDDVSSPDLDTLKRVLRKAEKAGTVLPGGQRPLWVTEFWWDSDPPDSQFGVPLLRQARWLEESLYVFWQDGASVAINLLLRDAGDTLAAGSGVFLSDGSPKPAYQAFLFPFVTERVSKQRVTAWGQSPQAGSLVIQQRVGGHWAKVKQLQTQQGEVFSTRLRLRGRQTLRATLGDEVSLPWRQRG